MQVSAANLAGHEVVGNPPMYDHDIKKNSGDIEGGQFNTHADRHHYDVSLAERVYWADKRRADEAADTRPIQGRNLATLIMRKHQTPAEDEKDYANQEHSDVVGLSERDVALTNARRALRLASWSSVFFLITCDILGPFNAPYAIASIGMAPGILLYILFGICAILSGYLLCQQFCKLDSIRHPIILYGDIARAIFGPWFRHLCSLLQFVQLVINVGLICLSNGQSLSQMSHAHLCFSICVLVWTLLGFVLGQVRSLNNFGVFASSSVVLNLLVIFISMGAFAHSGPNIAAAVASYGEAIASGPVRVAATVNQPVFSQVNGVFNMVFAWGGAMIFPEIMAEMRRPRDFIKGMACAQMFILVVYLVYGIYVYSFQGQYTIAVSYQGISTYGLQTACNAIGLVTGIIAAGLYGNIGLKVCYVYLVEDLCKGPPLVSRQGRYIWTVAVVIFWGLAFVIASAIPNVGALSGLVAAMCIFQFTYTFPPLMQLGLNMQLTAMKADEPFTTSGVVPKKIDSWRSASRWNRGFFGGGRKMTLANCGLTFYFIGALATAGLGLWATGTDLRESLAAGAASSFGCTPPV